MFKKSLLALALTTVAVGASAATLTTSSATVGLSTDGNVAVYGKEYISAGTAGVLYPTLQVTLGAQYSVGDIISFSVSGASYDLTNSTQSLAFGAGSTGSTMTVGLISSAAGKLTYRVTAASGNHSGATLTLSGMKLSNASAAAAGNITATYAAETSTGIVIDSATANSKVVAKTVDEYLVGFAAATDKLDATVSVGDLRKNFISGTTKAYDDALKVTFSRYTLLTGEEFVVAGAAPTATSVTLKGDFSFLDTNGDGKINASDKIASPLSVTGFGSSAASFATDLQSVVITGPTAFGNAGVTITAGNSAGDVTIKNQAFSAETSMTYLAQSGSTTASTKETATLSAGEWDLDGSQDKVDFVPFGADYARSITVSNEGTVEGAITVTLTAGGKSYTKTLTAVAAAMEITNISAEVNAVAAENGITGNAQLEVVVNAPAAKITVNSVYYAKKDGDRVLVPTRVIK